MVSVFSKHRPTDEHPEHSLQEAYEALCIGKEHLTGLFEKHPASEEDAFVALKKIADEEGLADAQFETGRAFGEGIGVIRSEKNAVKYYTLAADAGHLQAQFALAYLYWMGGEGVNDDSQAFYYAKMAAEGGNLFALVILGELYLEGKPIEKSPEKAFYYFKKAADEGCQFAYDRLADAYETGIGIEKSIEKAFFYRKEQFDLYKKRADAGDPEYEVIVGRNFECGIGVEKSPEKAFFYYQRAAGQGDLDGLTFLAECYEHGKGVEKSIELAVHYYTLAAERDFAPAQLELAKLLIENQLQQEKAVNYLKSVVARKQLNPELHAEGELILGECFEYGRGVKRSVQNALHFYRLAADHGNITATNRIAEAYLNGELGLKSSSEKAVEYFQSSALKGDFFGMMALAECYEKGMGINQSLEKAFQIYHQAAEIGIKKGLSTPIYKLAECYEGGIGIKKSLERALYYYRLAAENGMVTAEYKLGLVLLEMGGQENLKQSFHHISLAAEKEPIFNYNLGHAFEFGLGVDKSIEKAIHYYVLSGKAGEAEGFYQAGVLLLNQEGKEIDAFNLIRLSAEMDFHLGIMLLGQLYRDGQGTEQSYANSAHYYHLLEKTTEDFENAWFATYDLGFFYENGLGVDQSDEKAFLYYKKAADYISETNLKGPLARFKVGECYEHGRGVSPSLKTAIIYYEWAAKDGLEEAKMRLSKIKSKKVKIVSRDPVQSPEAINTVWKNTSSHILVELFHNSSPQGTPSG